VPSIARMGWEESKRNGSDLIIFDTAGRLQIDDELVQELEDLKNQINPHEILLVADAALGQEAGQCRPKLFMIGSTSLV
jgi:signal recognition particle subunit SRP54